MLVGCMLMTLQNNCDRVKCACLAQLVNVIAPIMTEDKGKAWVQPTFYPFMFASNRGRGTTLKSIVECDSYKEKNNRYDIPYLEASVINNEEKRELVVFAVNRSLEEDMTLSLNFENFADTVASEHVVLYNDDLKAENSAEKENVSPVNVEIKDEKGVNHEVTLKKHSWNMIVYKY